MAIWHKLLYWIGLRPNPGPRTYEIAESLHVSIATLAKHEGRPEHDLIPDILAAGLTQYSENDKIWKKWESLTPREQEATALLCLGLTNKQIAVQMGVTAAAIKFHLRNVYSKFQVVNRSQLRRILSGWDFSAWAKSPRRYHRIG